MDKIRVVPDSVSNYKYLGTIDIFVNKPDFITRQWFFKDDNRIVMLSINYCDDDGYDALIDCDHGFMNSCIPDYKGDLEELNFWIQDHLYNMANYTHSLMDINHIALSDHINTMLNNIARGHEYCMFIKN